MLIFNPTKNVYCIKRLTFLTKLAFKLVLISLGSGSISRRSDVFGLWSSSVWSKPKWKTRASNSLIRASVFQWSFFSNSTTACPSGPTGRFSNSDIGYVRLENWWFSEAQFSSLPDSKREHHLDFHWFQQEQLTRMLSTNMLKIKIGYSLLIRPLEIVIYLDI